MVQRHRIELDSGDEVAVVEHGDASNNAVFTCHGFGSNKSGTYEKICRSLADHGVGAVRFDFRGNGDSSLRFSEATVSTRIEDLISVIEFFDPDSFGLYGSSFGGRIASFYQNEFGNSDFLVLRAPALLDRVMNSYMTRFEREGNFEVMEGKRFSQRFVEDYQERSFSEVSIDCPSLVIQGMNDKYVPRQQTLRALNSFSELVYRQYEDEGHRFTDEAKNRMIAEIVDYVSGKKGFFEDQSLRD